MLISPSRVCTIAAASLLVIGCSSEAPQPASESPDAAAVTSTPAAPASPTAVAADSAADSPDAIAALVEGETGYGKCDVCHKIDTPTNGIGPHLVGIVGRPVASVEGYQYSAALKKLGGTWDAERLSQFLENPAAYAPGTKMTFTGLKDDDARMVLIDYLEHPPAPAEE